MPACQATVFSIALHKVPRDAHAFTVHGVSRTILERVFEFCWPQCSFLHAPQPPLKRAYAQPLAAGDVATLRLLRRLRVPWRAGPKTFTASVRCR